MKSIMKILINTALNPHHLEAIEEVTDCAVCCVAESAEEMDREIPEAVVVFGGVSREQFLKAKKLQWLQSLGAGVDGVLFPEFIESDVILVSAKGIVGIHLAEHAFALLLALSRGLKKAIETKSWEQRMPIRAKTFELAGKTMGIIGLGGTGRELARMASGFDMRIIAVDTTDVPAPDYVSALWKHERLEDLLRESDVVAICAPLTEETRGLMGRREFEVMKNSALLLNVTRGKIVDGEALEWALDNGQLAGAGLDVTPEEPLPQENSLWTRPNVIVTPHTSGGSPNRLDRSVGRFCENLHRFRNGEELIGIIDKRKGY